MKKVLASAMLTVLALAGASQAALISNLTSTNGSGQNVGTVVLTRMTANDSKVVHDRNHLLRSVPSYLVGGDFVQLSNNNHRTANPLSVTFNVSATEAMDVYLLIDTRIGSNYQNAWNGTPDPNVNGSNTQGGTVAGDALYPLNPVLTTKMTWVAAAGFVDTGIKIEVDEISPTLPAGDVNALMRLYKKTYAAGSTVTLSEQNDGTFRYAYGAVAVIPEPSSLVLLGLGGLAMLKRRRA